MTHSALSSKSVGISSGMSRISFRTVPQLSSRSASFFESAVRGKATREDAIRKEIIRFNTIHLVVVFWARASRSEEHTSELQSRLHLVCRLLLEKKKTNN